MPAAKKSSGIIAVRANNLFIGPPGPMGWACLTEPDDAFDSLKFNVQVHQSEEAVERLGALIDAEVIDPLWPKLMEALEEAKKAEPRGGWQKPSGRAWVEDHLKTPSERSKVQLPFIKWENAAEYKSSKTGQMERKTMRAYDAKNALLDLPALNLGMGSIVQPVLIPGLFACAPLINKGQPAPSFKLQGVRVIQLVQYSKGGGRLGELSDEDMSMLGDDVEVSDLGSYTKGPEDPQPRKQERRSDFDLDDEIPF